uniref:RING-type E3 ubiquitin transferase n=1 Tax=Wuchereria bancrofti TaxID=6293 RepID=A0A1I8EJ00_WUCBA
MGSVDNSSSNAPLNPVAGTSEMVDDGETTDICRVCRSAGDSALYYPCLCTGSIKYVHQDCLLEWLKYSKKEPIYRSDMPQTLPLSEIIRGILLNMGRILRSWAIYTLVLVAWLGIVPITACRIYRIVFSASLSSMLSLPFQLFSPDNLLVDCLKGCFIVSIFLCAFISLVWLREQIIHGGPQEWLNLEDVARGANAENALDDNVDAVVAEARAEIAGNDIEEGEVEERGDEVEQGQEDVAVQDQADNDNWREWERVADELTWQRLLGLDGSLLFLEHVFWVISLNTLFTVLFAFLPYQLGHFFLKTIGLASRIAYFPTLTSVLLGYFILSLIVRCLHVTAKISRLAPLSRRIASFMVSPTSSLFMHWLIGMVYVFYSASFVLVLREVLRPGVLWFLRNLNDPEFNPIQEMIELPVIRHLRRLIASTSIFFTTILLLIYVPLCFITRYIPSVLPFNLSLAAETPVSELSLELLVLQVVLPALLEQTHARTILKTVVRTWCCIFGRLLQLEHYLLPMEENENGRQQREAPPAQPVAGLGLAAQHQALLLVREPQGFQAYNKPSHFSLRVIALLIALSLTSMFTSVMFCVIPVTFGRFIVHRISGHTNIHDLYTVAAGLYGCWILLKLFFLVLEYAPQGTFFLFSAFRNMALTAVKLCAVSVPILIVIPLLAGISFHLAVISPIRIALHQTSLLFPWQHWAMGILHCKIFCAAVMMGPNWWMKHVFEQLYADGIRGLRVHYLYKQLVAPVLACLAIHLSAPRVICSLISVIIDVSNEEQIIFLRYSYPATLLCVFCFYFVYWQCSKFKALAEKIRNDKYLVGTQLVNYERNHAEFRH